MTRSWPVALAVVLAASGCGSGGDAPARQAVERFEAALTAGRTTEACGLLTPEATKGLDCTALRLPHGTVRELTVRGDAARARVGDDTVFLREKAVGWRVSGAGCTRQEERPYDCEVGGP